MGERVGVGGQIKYVYKHYVHAQTYMRMYVYCTLLVALTLKPSALSPCSIEPEAPQPIAPAALDNPKTLLLLGGCQKLWSLFGSLL